MNLLDEGTPSLLDLKQGLAEDYDRLAQAWKEAEAFLVSMHIGEEFQVLVYEEEDSMELLISRSKEGVVAVPEDNTFGYWLGFRQWDGKWGIYYGKVSTAAAEPYDGFTTWKPILECSKEERLVAAESLPELLSKAVEEAEKVRVRVAKATETITGAVRSALKK